MSFLKNFQLEKLDITKACEETPSARLGEEITSISYINYNESIFSPSFFLEIQCVTLKGVFSDLELRGTERADIEMIFDSGRFDFEGLVVTNMKLDDVTSTSNIFTIKLQSKDVINNEKERLYQRYDPKVNASTHVTNILKNHIRESDEERLDIEQTANSDGFYGNYWTPFRSIYWLARRAISKSMSKDGSGTQRVGFLFWQTHTGYKFKSIDTIIAEGNKKKFKYVQSEIVDPEQNNENFHLYNIVAQQNQDIIQDMSSSRFGERRRFVNLHMLYDSKLDDESPLSEADLTSSQSTLGDDEDQCLNYDIRENPSKPSVVVVVDSTMRKDSKTSVFTDGEFNPTKVITQSKRRYQSLLSHSLRVTVPLNVKLESGDVISVETIKSLEGVDKHTSGLYLIKDLKHTVQIKEDGLQCTTDLRLVRDSQGENIDSDESTSSSSPSLGFDPLTNAYTA
tara:strand:- start:97 stop:1458 length:1362 start_codon:yes stop_codon:yes gene_type:complete